MIKKTTITTLYCCFFTIFHVGCSSNRAVTAEEFVEKHSKAYSSRDEKAVAGMTLCAEDLAQTALPQSIKEELKSFHRDSLTQAVRREMKEGNLWVAAWQDTKYVSEKDLGDRIKVEVTVGYARSSIVLVRVGKQLKIAPNPSSYE
jgi:hypothetical protein